MVDRLVLLFRRDLIDRDLSLLLGVELDVERQLVGQAAVEGDLVRAVDAEEVDLAAP